jgi:hypothetical protein
LRYDPEEEWAKAPAWIIVTSQEKLEEVVSALDSKRVQLAKLQDRFRHRVDLAPSDIREVATKRVLAKKDKAEPPLKKLFSEYQGQLNDTFKLERSARKTEITEADFVQFYPYPPHYIDLCISIVSGLRLQPGAPKQYGGRYAAAKEGAGEVNCGPWSFVLCHWGEWTKHKERRTER